MYNDNENDDFSQLNPEEHTEVTKPVNFTMKEEEQTENREVTISKEQIQEEQIQEKQIQEKQIQEEQIQEQQIQEDQIQEQQIREEESWGRESVQELPLRGMEPPQINEQQNDRQQTNGQQTNGQQTNRQQTNGQQVGSPTFDQPYGQPSGRNFASNSGPQHTYGQNQGYVNGNSNGGSGSNGDFGSIPHYQEHQYRENQYQGNQYQGNQYQGNQYQGNQYQGDNARLRNAPEDQKPRKKGGFIKRAAALIGSALVFGIISGSVMVSVNWVAGNYVQENSVSVSTAETLPAPEPAKENTVVSGLDVSTIVDKAMPSVVAISSKMIYESQTWFGTMQQEGTGSGSGIIVGQNEDELLIVTNNHVVQGAEEVKVAFIDDTAVDAAIKGTDSDSDLAVIAVKLKDIPAEALSQITIANMGNSDSLKVGKGVIAIGNALGYGQSVTVGYISALSRTVQTEGGVSSDLLQTDAAINPGNSGGALLNMQGELIGINSAKYSSTDVEGMGYAIPISKAQDIINELMTKKTRVQVAAGREGYLGIQCQNIDATTSQRLGMPQGVFIYKIVDGGAASKSELREKDIIMKFDGQSVRSYEDLTNMLMFYESGSTVTITVQSLENGEYVERKVDVTLEKRPAQEIQIPKK